jgi:dihydroflavonol-4-reductase
MKALVTGGTGFIGSHLVEALLARGFEVRCLVRDPVKPGWLEGLDVELVKGDCNEPGSLAGITGDVDYVFHAAGVTKAAKGALYYKVNGEGTKNMAEAAAGEAKKLKKFVYVSSQAASGPSRRGFPRKEDDPSEPVSDYGRSKLLGERYALAVSDRIDLAIVRPTSVYGPRDKDIYTFFKMVSRGFKTAFRNERLISVCYVDDLVEGILLAAACKARSGEAFFIADSKPYDWDEMGEAIEQALKVKARRIVVPIPALSVVALFSEAAGWLSGRPALLNRQKMAEIRQRYWVVDVRKAEAVLGFRARYDFSAGAKLTAEWYRRHGWILGRTVHGPYQEG